MHIAQTSEVHLLNASDNMEAWEEIVRHNCEVNGAHEYTTYLNLAKSYALTVNEYISIKASLIKLAIVIDKDLVQWLLGKGYKIDTISSLKYAESLVNADKKSSNLLTRIQMKKNEMDRMAIPGNQKSKTLEELLAALSFQIGFPVNEDVTLARFNEYNRILKLRAEQEKNGRAK